MRHRRPRHYAVVRDQVLGSIARNQPFSRGKLELPLMATIHRRKTVTAVVGGVRVGSDAPVVVQSMTNTDTADVPSTVQQVAALARAGSELVRVTVSNDDAAAAVPRIVAHLHKQGV